MLYGTTFGVFGAGSCASGGCGTVFRITTGGNERPLLQFSGAPNGADPFGGLTVVKGVLYGTTLYGGKNDAGSLFSITTKGTEKVMYSFGANAYDCVNPYAQLLEYGGSFYGTTAAGGDYGFGTAFRINSKTGKEVWSYSFDAPGGHDGVDPYSGLVELGGVLYGTTSSGGRNAQGTVFKLTTSGKETPLEPARRHSVGPV